MAASVTTLKKKGFLYDLNRYKVLFLMILPVIIAIILFSYLPMVGVYYAFTNFNFEGGLFGSPFVGFKNFEFLFASGTLAKITMNTVLYNIAFKIFGSVADIVLAIMLAEITGRIFKKVTQGMMLLPHFISYVLVSTFAYNLLSIDTGLINSILKGFGFEPYSFYSDPSVWKYIFVIVNVWKGTGYGSIVYLATIMNISSEYYESAKIDGANIFQQIWHITLPMIKPVFILLQLFSIGGILRGQFDMFFQLVGTNSLLRDATDIIDTYVFRCLTADFDIGMGTAAGLYQSFFGFLLVIVSNALVKKYNPEYALY